MGTYYQDPNFEVDVAEFVGQQPCVLETTYKKNTHAKGSNRPSGLTRTYHLMWKKLMNCLISY